MYFANPLHTSRDTLGFFASVICELSLFSRLVCGGCGGGGLLNAYTTSPHSLLPVLSLILVFFVFNFLLAYKEFNWRVNLLIACASLHSKVTNTYVLILNCYTWRYEKLQRWDDALTAYVAKASQASNPHLVLEATLGLCW